MHEMQPFSDDTPSDLNARWWAPTDKADLAHDTMAVFNHLNQLDRGRQTANLHHTRLYGNLPIEGVNPGSYNRLLTDDRLTLNVIANVCDVATARIGKLRPAPKPLTTEGNYSLRRKSKLLERFLQAQFRISKVYEQTRRAFLDATVMGTGCLKIFDTDKRIVVERVFPSEIIVDPLEALYGEPRQMFQRKWVSKAVLKEAYLRDLRSDSLEYQERKRALDEASGDGLDEGFADDGRNRDQTVGDQILVVEAWHLRSGADAKDGKHVICTSGGLLFEEEWEYDYFPFEFIHWKERLRGFWGVGLAEELCGIQTEINRLLIRLQTGHKRLGHPMVFIDARSKVQKNALTNEIGTFVNYMGNPPQVVTFDTARPEIYAHLDRLYQRAFDMAGMSQDTAAPGTQSLSGVSAETQHEIGTERFSIQAQRHEEAHLSIARKLIDRAKAISERNGGKYALPAEKDRNTISAIDWSEVDMEEDQYILQVLPVSALPQLPSAKQKRVADMMAAGMLTPQEGLELLDFPDVERFVSLARAGKDVIERQLENMLDEGIREAAEPWMDLQLCLKTGQNAMLKAMNDGAPEENLQLVRDWLLGVHALMQRAQVEQMKLAAAQAAQQGPVAPGPGAPPAPGPGGQPPGALNPTDGM
jgi:hypothetical protein